MYKSSFLLIVLCFLFACKQDLREPIKENTVLDLKTALPGVWESVSVRVDINTANNTDSTDLFEVREENWEKTLGIKPIRTYYELDNKYRTEYRSRTDSLANLKRGIWNTFGDTLMLIEPDVTYQYIVSLKPNGLAEFRSTLDWDGDGQEDDEYVGVQRFVSKSTQ